MDMNIGAMLRETGAIDSIAKELNIDPQVAGTAAGALLPAIVAGLGRNQVGTGASGGGGLGDILGSVLGGSGGGLAGGLGGGLGGILLDQVLNKDPTPVDGGNDILGQIFGSKDVSRGVADEVSGSTGISSDIIRKMLPILAMAVVGYMLKQNGGKGQGGGALGGALGGLVGSIVQGMVRR